MTASRKIFNVLSNIIITVLQLNRPNKLYQMFMSRINVVKKVNINGTDIIFDSNEELHYYRASTAATKEPETIEWINTFKDDDVFYDIGANVGVYTLYAALHGNLKVYAFEPESKNYACLNKNLALNNLGKKVGAFNIGLHDTKSIDYLYLQNTQSGAALQSVGEPVDWKGDRYESVYEQTVLAYPLDEFIETFNLPVPNHVKIDVDGNELKIVNGAKKTLSNESVRTLSIELTENDVELKELIESCGLVLTDKTYAKTEQGLEELGLGNYLFKRKD